MKTIAPRNLLFAAMLALGGGILAGGAWAQSDGAAEDLSPERVEAIEQVIREYLMDHPEVLIESLNAYEDKRRLAERENQRRAIVSSREALWNDPDSPVLGNPDGDVVLVEFFDYRCGYCKLTAPRIQQLIDEDPNLKVVMKEFPILSQESFEGAKAALAADRQGRYEEFHFALMDQPGDLSERHLRAIAARSGVDPDRMVQDMALPEIEQAIRRNHTMGQLLGVSGTPAVIIGDHLYPGAAELEQLQEMIARARTESG